MEEYELPNDKKILKRGILKNVAIVILLLVIVGLFTVPQYLDKIYNQGYQTGLSDALVDLATQQTQTGNILIVYNNSLQAVPMATLCQIAAGVQG